MSRSGPPPTPTALRILRGNPSKRPLPAAEPTPPVVVPPCPRGLSAEARREWRRLAPVLARLGVLTELDRAGLAAYCQVWARWREAERRIAREGAVIVARSGWAAQSPWISIAQQALRELRAYLAEFGLTPATRSRVSAQPRSGQDDERDFFDAG